MVKAVDLLGLEKVPALGDFAKEAASQEISARLLAICAAVAAKQRLFRKEVSVLLLLVFFVLVLFLLLSDEFLSHDLCLFQVERRNLDSSMQEWFKV